jgi:hypothetical protein
MQRPPTEAQTKCCELESEQSHSSLKLPPFCDESALRACQFYQWKKRFPAVNHTHRKRPAAFEALPCLAEPAGLSSFRSGKRSSKTAFNSDL